MGEQELPAMQHGAVMFLVHGKSVSQSPGYEGTSSTDAKLETHPNPSEHPAMTTPPRCAPHCAHTQSIAALPGSWG